MAHHGNDPFDGQNKKAFEAMRKTLDDRTPMKPFFEQKQSMEDGKRKRQMERALLDVTGFKGAMGTHSQGKLTPSDEGDIQFRVGSENGKVVLDFGTPTVWVGMDAQQAADLASLLFKWARIVGRKEGVTIAINLSAP